MKVFRHTSNAACWVAGSVDSERQPPGRQAAQSQGRVVRCEGSPVVAAKHFGQPMLLKNTRHLRLHGFGSRIVHGLSTQHVSAKLIANRQRFEASSITRVPPALKVDRPNVIGAFRLERVLQATSLFARHASPRRHQAHSTENPLKTALRGQVIFGERTFEHGPQLTRPPGSMRQLQLHNLTHDRFVQSGTSFGPSRLIGQAGNAVLYKTLLPLVTSLARNTVLLAQLRKVLLPIQSTQRKFGPSVHEVALLPRHKSALLSESHFALARHLCPEPSVLPMS